MDIIKKFKNSGKDLMNALKLTKKPETALTLKELNDINAQFSELFDAQAEKLHEMNESFGEQIEKSIPAEQAHAMENMPEVNKMESEPDLDNIINKQIQEPATLRKLWDSFSGEPRAREKKIHAGLMLAAYCALDEVIHAVANPAKLFHYEYDLKKKNLTFEKYKGCTPRNGTLITALDTLFAANLLEDLPVLFEGSTGGGKTFWSELYLPTLLGKDNYAIFKFNNVRTDPLSLITDSEIPKNGGFPKDIPKKDLMDRLGAFFVDEMNRGDTNVLFDLSQGSVSIEGKKYKLGVAIPKIGETGISFDENKRKFFFIGAQNPPPSKNAGYMTEEVDLALYNRFFVIEFEDSPRSTGAAVMDAKRENNLDKKFITAYQKHIKNLLGITLSETDLEYDRLAHYGFITDPEKTKRHVIRLSKEVADSLVFILGKNLQSVVEQELASVSDTFERLKEKYNIEMPSFEFDYEKDELKEIIEKTQNYDWTTRDVAYIEKYARFISTVSMIKSALNKKNPVDRLLDDSQAYFVLPEHIAAAVILNGHSKGVELKECVNEVFKSSMKMMFAHCEDEYLRGIKFNIFKKSLKDSKDTSSLIESISDHANKAYFSAESEIEKLIALRMTKNLSQLMDFLALYKDETDMLLNKYTTCDKRLEALDVFYQKKIENPNVKHRFKEYLSGVYFECLF